MLQFCMIIFNWEVRVVIVCYPGSTVTRCLVSQFLAASGIFFFSDFISFNFFFFFFLIYLLIKKHFALSKCFYQLFFFLEISMKNLSAKFPLSIHSSCNGTFCFCKVRFLKGSAVPCSSPEVLVQPYFMLINGGIKRKDI